MTRNKWAVGHWILADGNVQPVSVEPSLWERLVNRVLHGWTWLKYES